MSLPPCLMQMELSAVLSYLGSAGTVRSMSEHQEDVLCINGIALLDTILASSFDIRLHRGKRDFLGNSDDLRSD